MNALQKLLRDALDRRLNAPYIRTVCCMVLGVQLIIQTISFATADRGPTLFGPYLGADFASYYVAGSIFNSNHPEKIYDLNLQNDLYRGLFPRVPPKNSLPYANAPFFVLPFAILAYLPYAWAYLFWMLVCSLLYFSGLKLLMGTLEAPPAGNRPTALLLALSFAPFLVEGVAGGQASAFGFFGLALTLTLERRRHNMAAGAALSLLAYKPTLLVLILPMLFITRRKKLLYGFALGNLALALVSVLAVGWEGCSRYISNLLGFFTASTGAASIFRTWKYVDINSFSKLLLSGHAWGRLVIVLLALGGILPLLMRLWVADRERDHDGSLVWAITIVWTLVLNVYLALYDTILVVVSVLITSDLLGAKGAQSADPRYKYLLVLLYLTPWVTQTVARWSGIQLYTVVLAAFGYYLIWSAGISWRYGLERRPYALL